MRDPQPRVVLPQLRDQVVGDKAHRRRQSVQHDGDKGLQERAADSEILRGAAWEEGRKRGFTLRERNTVLAVIAKVRM